MPIDIGAGFALMGQSVAQTAQAAALEMIRSEAEERRVKLANDLADARESKGRAETQAFQTSEREAKERFETPERDAKIASQKAQTNQAQTATDIAKDKWSRQTRAGDEMAGALDGKGGTSKSYTDRIAQFESGGGKMVPNELGSGAYGPYQFMPGTWSDVRAKNTDLGLPEDMKQATPDQHKAAFDRFTAGNADALKRAGIEPTAANLYLAHRFGPAGAEKVIKADENAPLGNVLPGDWQQQNPDMRGQTAGGFKRLAEERMKGVTLGDGGTTGTGTDAMPADLKAAITALGRADPDKAASLLAAYRQQDRALAMKDKTPQQSLAEWYAKAPDAEKEALKAVIGIQREPAGIQFKEVNGKLVAVDPRTAKTAVLDTPGAEKPLDNAARDDLKKVADPALSLIRLTSTFKDGYAGQPLLGEAVNLMGRNTNLSDSAKAQAQWWQQYQGFANVQSHELFGAALSATEAARFEKAMVNPGMQPDVIKKNLDTQREIATTAISRIAGALMADGYNPKAVEAMIGMKLADLPAPTPMPGRADTAGPTPQAPGRVDPASAMNDARDAISRGAPPAAVMQRLRQLGIDPSGLDQ